MELEDRYRGSLLGLAVGDAVGTTLEFSSPGSFVPLGDMVGGGPFNLKPGEWTDDTSMALCSTSFQEGCLLAVNLGDDADTTGAVYGQLAGAFYGASNIPQQWRTRLAHLSLIESLADQLLALSRMTDADKGR